MPAIYIGVNLREHGERHISQENRLLSIFVSGSVFMRIDHSLNHKKYGFRFDLMDAFGV